MNGDIKVGGVVTGSVSGMQNVSGKISVPTSEKADDYNPLKNHPSINGIELIGNKTTEELLIDTEAEWGEITGELDRQEDLMGKFQEQKAEALSVTDIEKILYLG